VTPSSLSRVLDDLAASAGIAIDRTLAGTMIGEYHVVSRIGEGGMGTVYGAIHPLIGKRVAIKVMRADVGSSTDGVERFLREARAVARIGHPNIVDIFAFGSLPDGRNYYVMEWLVGSTLFERSRTPMTLGEVVFVIDQIARGLEAAHAAAVVHRDLKPENVFLVDVPGEPVRVKLLDFGIAKLIDDIDHTTTGLVLGTPLYVSPEQARGLRIDARTDIYSLGVMMFELMAGTLPFISASAYDLLTLHVAAVPPAASDFHPGLPAPIVALLDAMLAKDPSARPSLATLRATIAPFASDRSQPITWAPRSLARVRARGSAAPCTQPVPYDAEESGILISPPRSEPPAPTLRNTRARGRYIVAVASIAIGAVIGTWMMRPTSAPSSAPEVVVTPDLPVAPVVTPIETAREVLTPTIASSPTIAAPETRAKPKRATKPPARSKPPVVAPRPRSAPVRPASTVRDPFAGDVHDPFEQ
jgi:serine/threonine-protein kinase